MATDSRRTGNGILGDIDPAPEPDNPRAGEPIRRNEPPATNVVPDEAGDGAGTEDPNEAMSGGSQHDRAKHSGSRDVTEGVTGGLGTETGGSRNYRSGSGATGGDIGNRPE